MLSNKPLRFFFSSRRRHTRCQSDWSSDVCSSDLGPHKNNFSATTWRRLSVQCHILFAKAENSVEVVGRTPWSARDALVPLPEQRYQHLARREQADGGVGRGQEGPPHQTSQTVRRGEKY